MHKLWILNSSIPEKNGVKIFMRFYIIFDPLKNNNNFIKKAGYHLGTFPCKHKSKLKPEHKPKKNQA